MTTQPVYYFNDERKPIKVFVETFMEAGRSLLPAEGAMFQVPIPEGRALFIKKWRDIVLLTYTQAKVS